MVKHPPHTQYSLFMISLVSFVFFMGLLSSPRAVAVSAADLERIDQESQRLIQEQQQREKLQRREIEERIRAPRGEKLEPKAPVQKPKDSHCFQVNSVLIDGATKLPDSVRDEILKPVIGHCVGLTEINLIIQSITNYYVAQGYTTTRAYIPEQDMTSGDLKILVLEGLVERIMLEGSGASLATALPGLQGDLFNLRDFEQGIDQINRLQSNSATIDIAPGQKPGTSTVIIRNEPRKRWTFNVASDNTGSESTGFYQTSATLGLDDLFGANDYFNFSVRTNPDRDTDSKLSQSVSSTLVIPYGYWTLSGSVSDFRYASLVQGSVTSFQTSGSARTYNLKLDRVVYRDQRMKWSLSGALTAKENRNFLNQELIQTSSRKLSVFDLGSNVTFTALGGIWSLDLGASHGLRLFGAQVDADSLPNTAPRAQFTRYTYGISVQRPFELADQKLSFMSAVTGQYASDVLFGTEQTSIGGPFSIRGFRKFSIAGDSGVTWRNEMGLPIALGKLFGEGAPQGQIKPYLAYDVGYIRGKYGVPGGSLSGLTLGVTTLVANASIQVAYSQALSVPSRLGNGDQYFFVRAALDF